MTQAVFPSDDQTVLLIIDVQERLMAAMSEARVATMVKSHLALVEMARLFDVPVVLTEQYPRGLGPTLEPIRSALREHHRVEKTEFSACANATFREEVLETLPRDVILTGSETHVCVLQTALDLMAAGRRVFVPHDAVCSRTERNIENGLALIERGGGVVTNSETLIFRRLGRAGGDVFKRLSKMVK